MLTVGETGWQVYRNSVLFLQLFCKIYNYSKIKGVFKKTSKDNWLQYKKESINKLQDIYIINNYAATKYKSVKCYSAMKWSPRYIIKKKKSIITMPTVQPQLCGQLFFQRFYSFIREREREREK